MNLLSSVRRLSKPILVIVMGVSGSGKTTLAKLLSERLSFRYVEADDFHSDQAKQKMAAGIPLTDQDRLPWITCMCDFLNEQFQQQQSCVLSYSGLRAKHREAFRALPFDTLFVFLHGKQEIILQRMQQRQGHYMPATLLQSQFDSLESPQGEQNVVAIDLDASKDIILDNTEKQIAGWLLSLQ
ncbi:gluconokinase [Neptunicella sp. SCSIO 80796]|uniref:gluconokinase n=1 Tax=Neptunicella plasticusilytica TaxID=3117012 RepID=UPI003A4D65FC